MIVAGDRAELAAAWKSLGRRSAERAEVALVPTMGALHEGHRSLLRLAAEHAEHVAVSIFVNPLQFGPSEDFSRYPRTLDADLDICATEGVSVVFTPSATDMYPAGRQVGVSAGEMGRIVEGEFRPGHFDGVLTVVLKLFNLVQPDIAVFGQKDAQQLALIRRMVADLNLPIRIVGAPTIREAGGLALSSRNRYLSPAERDTALSLSRALHAAAAQTAPDGMTRAARAVLDQAARAEPPLALDYLALVDPATFTAVESGHRGEAVLAVAGKVGTTRLIDNVVLTVSDD